jgi:hypothetical protein
MPRDIHVDRAARIVLHDLAWWARARRDAHSAGALPPVRLRLMSAADNVAVANIHQHTRPEREQ